MILGWRRQLVNGITVFPITMWGNLYPWISFHQWRSYPKPTSNTMYIKTNPRGVRLALALAKPPSFPNTIMNYSARHKSDLNGQTKALQPLDLLRKWNYWTPAYMKSRQIITSTGISKRNTREGLIQGPSYTRKQRLGEASAQYHNSSGGGIPLIRQ